MEKDREGENSLHVFGRVFAGPKKTEKELYWDFRYYRYILNIVSIFLWPSTCRTSYLVPRHINFDRWIWIFKVPLPMHRFFDTRMYDGGFFSSSSAFHPEVVSLYRS